MTTWAPPRVTPWDALVRRAMSAYWRGKNMGDARYFPSVNHSRCESWYGRQYVVLSDGRSVAAVYRVRSDGILRRMKRPPRVIQP